MGLFGGIGKALKGVDWGKVLAHAQSAGAITHGDYGTAGAIMGQHRKGRQDQRQAEAEQQQRAQLEAAVVQMGVPPEQARSLPSSSLAGLVSQQYTPRAPSEFERSAQAGGIMPGTPEWQHLNRQRANTMAMPSPQPIVDPQTGSVRWVTPPAPGQPQTPQAGGPQPGAVVNGFRFRGGNPNDRNNWEPAGGGGGNVTGTFRFGGQRTRF